MGGADAAFTHSLVGNWHPLTSISLMLDAQIFGLNPGGYHFTNVLLHTIGVLLLFFALRQMTGAVWRSAFVAALFAIHPLRAESVVWISERKDVLSGVFFFLALLAYVRYAREPRSLGHYLLLAVFLLSAWSRRRCWSLCRFCFCPGLLAAAALCGRGRFDDRPDASSPVSVRRLILEKLPLLALVVGGIDRDHPFPGQRPGPGPGLADELAGRERSRHDLDLSPPDGVAGSSHCFLSASQRNAAALGCRVGFALFPRGLAWRVPLAQEVSLFFHGLVLVRRDAGAGRRSGAGGLQAHADRYTYLPQIGIYLLLTWAMADLSASWRTRRLICAGLALAILGALLMVAWRQTGYWAESVRFWTHTLAVTKNNDVAERGIGTALLKVGRIEEAIAHDRAALRIHPHDLSA